MTYSIRKTDGSLVIDLGVGVTDLSRTSIALIGKNAADYGLNQNQNFVRILENFANSVEPSYGLVGQLWFDSSAEQIKVKTESGYKSIGPFPDPTTPVTTDKSTSYATTEFVQNLLPKGSIILWYGALATIPTGWALCNGQVVNGATTPDLTKKFVMGAGVSLSGGGQPGYTSYAPGATGGTTKITSVISHKHTFSTITDNNNVGHNHGGTTNSAGVHEHGYPGDDQLSFGNGVAGWTASSLGGFPYDARSSYGGGAQIWKTTSNGSHSHTLNIGDQSADHHHAISGETTTVGDATIDITNPYYALAYIMKTI